MSSFRGRAVRRASHDSTSLGRFRFLVAVVDIKIVHSAFRFIAWVLAIGGSVVSGVVVASLIRREQDRKLVEELKPRDKGRSLKRSELEGRQ